MGGIRFNGTAAMLAPGRARGEGYKRHRRGDWFLDALQQSLKMRDDAAAGLWLRDQVRPARRNAST
jgi:hypothetical protein